jgi:Protein of unknown function (DUF4232)
MRPFATPSTRLIKARALAAAFLVGSLGALCAVASPAAGSAAKTAAAGCRTSGLVVWLDTQGNGTAGTIFYTLHFTNLSGATCTLRGYPGVSAVTLTGQQLGRAASRDSGNRVRTITIRNGRTASATLAIVDAGNFPRSSCGQVTAAGLKVFPPNQTAAKTIPFPFTACSRSGPTYLRIRAVR